MLELNNVYKTFNLGTINEKKALNGVNLKLEDGDFVTVIGGIYHSKCCCRCMAYRFGKYYY